MSRGRIWKGRCNSLISGWWCGLNSHSHLHLPAITKPKDTQDARETKNFHRRRIQLKIVPCPGAGYRRGQRQWFGQWMMVCACGSSCTYSFSCLVQGEVGVVHLTVPWVWNSSSLLSKFSRRVPCPRAGYRRAETVLWSVNVGLLKPHLPGQRDCQWSENCPQSTVYVRIVHCR